MGEFGGTGLLLSLMLLWAAKASNEFSKIMADEESGITITTKEGTATAMSDVTAYKLLAMEGTTFSTSGMTSTSIVPQTTTDSSTSPTQSLEFISPFSRLTDHTSASEGSTFKTEAQTSGVMSTDITAIGSQPANTTELFSTTPGPSTIQQAATSSQTVSMTDDTTVMASNTTDQVTTPKMHTTTKLTFTTGIISTTKPLPTPPPCLNGGTFINGVCHCLGNFEGSKCESYSSLVTIDSTDMATEVKVKINETFHEEYTDPQSLQYKEFVQDFTNKMELVYRRKVENYMRLNIIKISQGSVVVEHEVVVNITNGPNITEAVNQIPEEIVEALKLCMAGECSGIEFLETPTVVKPTFSPQLICDQHIPKEYRNYYTAIMETGGITCVSLCDSEHNNTKNCNTGDCRIMNTGPTCKCPEGYWYSETDCYGPIQKIAVFSVTGVLAAVLVIFVMTSIICMVYKGKQTKRLKGSKDDQMTEWVEDDFHWSSSHKGAVPVGFSREFSTETKLPSHNNSFDGWQFEAQRHLQSMSSGSVTGSSYYGPQQYLAHKRPDSVYQSFYGQRNDAWGHMSQTTPRDPHLSKDMQTY
ncbi:mucin-17-like isoform X2 [Paramormyrops kingsleyae]|uniref:mucin-17-like isoform X2 n=1 Tax=Paramormyrops kingsleyae TaxID=1676925 RepID=UPI000CD5E03D|nr:mucin-17-like isoform X2 [Paramormyrops kingsleyae]